MSILPSEQEIGGATLAGFEQIPWTCLGGVPHSGLQFA